MSETTDIAWTDRACSRCDVIKGAEGFHSDKSHRDGRTSVCRQCRNIHARSNYTVKDQPERHGPLPAPGRDGDKLQARHRVNRAILAGDLPPPNCLPCIDCNHVWRTGERRHEYDHHLGYAAQHHLCVQPVCTLCHSKRDNARAKQTECIRGHAFTPDNTRLKPTGQRICLECRRARDRARRGAAYWRAYREAKHG